MANKFTLDYESNSEYRELNQEALTLEEMGQVPPGACFLLEKLVTEENSRTRVLIQLIPRLHNYQKTRQILQILSPDSPGETNPGKSIPKGDPSISIPIELGTVYITPVGVVCSTSSEAKFLTLSTSDNGGAYSYRILIFIRSLLAISAKPIYAMATSAIYLFFLFILLLYDMFDQYNVPLFYPSPCSNAVLKKIINSTPISALAPN